MSEKQTHNIKTILTFIVPSLIGLLLFMMPISYQDALTIPIAIISKGLQNLLSGVIVAMVTFVVIFTA
ncbi:YjiH family protein, partial [Shewanella sp. 0m-11]